MPCDRSFENLVNPIIPVNPVENSSRRERETVGVSNRDGGVASWIGINKLGVGEGWIGNVLL